MRTSAAGLGAMAILANGSAAPDFRLTAVVSERSISPMDVPGKFLLFFHTYHTATEVGAVVKALKSDYMDTAEVTMASVVDLRGIPRFIHPLAKRIMSDAYYQAAREVPDGYEVADHIIVLPDWKGVAFKAYQIPNSHDQVALVLIDENKVVEGSYVGKEPLVGARNLLVK
jgi:hypothetical protein